MLAIYTSHGHYIRSKAWNMMNWGPEARNPSNNIGISAHYFSAVAKGNDVHLTFLSTDILLYTKYSYSSNSWGVETKIQPQPVTTTSAPFLSIDSAGDLHLFWAGSPKANHIYYKRMSGGAWEPSLVDWINESAEGLTGNDSLTTFYEATPSPGLVYLTRPARPYNVKFAD